MIEALRGISEIDYRLLVLAQRTHLDIVVDSLVERISAFKTMPISTRAKS